MSGIGGSQYHRGALEQQGEDGPDRSQRYRQRYIVPWAGARARVRSGRPSRGAVAGRVGARAIDLHGKRLEVTERLRRARCLVAVDAEHHTGATMVNGVGLTAVDPEGCGGVHGNRESRELGCICGHRHKSRVKSDLASS